jgi:hypothetical protein
VSLCLLGLSLSNAEESCSDSDAGFLLVDRAAVCTCCSGSVLLKNPGEESGCWRDMYEPGIRLREHCTRTQSCEVTSVVHSTRIRRWQPCLSETSV